MKKGFCLLLTILVIGAILRLYNLSVWQYFSYDQARDFLIIKKILLEGKFTLIGPSLGIADGAYLPPFYYYLTAPFLLLSRFHLWGPDFFSVLIGLGGVIVFYLLAKEMFGKKPAFLASLFYTLNPYMIQASRHIRNPHLLPLFLLLFAFYVLKFLENKKVFFLYFSTIFLAISVSLHITAIVFLPVLVYLFFIQLKRKSSLSILISVMIFFLFFAPLLVFDLRHGFGVSKAVVSFFAEKGGSGLGNKVFRFLIFFCKIPVILFSGNFQKELLSLRSFPILSLEQINLFKLPVLESVKLFLSLVVWMFVLVFSFRGLKDKRIEVRNKFKLILILIFLGFCISFLLPQNYSYLYYFYNLFPFIFLLFSGCFFLFFEKIKNKIFLALFLFLAVISFFPNGLKTEIRPEKYFLPSAKIIAQDFSSNDKVAVAANINESNRWEKNGIEYRYFLESLYELPFLGSKENDYKSANVLYLIDEGDLKEPLKMGGMEMETFRPAKIEKVWEVETGQKIYKMTK